MSKSVVTTSVLLSCYIIILYQDSGQQLYVVVLTSQTAAKIMSAN